MPPRHVSVVLCVRCVASGRVMCHVAVGLSDLHGVEIVRVHMPVRDVRLFVCYLGVGDGHVGHPHGFRGVRGCLAVPLSFGEEVKKLKVKVTWGKSCYHRATWWRTRTLPPTCTV